MTKINRAACLESCQSEGGNLIGRDPRRMGGPALAAAGFERASRTHAVRAKCLDCAGGSAQEVRYCVSVDCALWPFRMGTDPFRAPMTEERKEAARALLKNRLATPADAGS